MEENRGEQNRKGDRSRVYVEGEEEARQREGQRKERERVREGEKIKEENGG